MNSKRRILALSLVLGSLGGFVAGERLSGRAADPPGEIILPRDWNSYATLVKRVLPAVVNVEGQGKSSTRAKFDDVDPGFGSGFLIDPKGIIVTNNHVVRESKVVAVTLHDGRKFMSQIILRDPTADLAVIRIEAREALPYLEFGDSDAMEVGDRVLAVGSPFGLTGSVTHGIVSGKSRNLNLNVHEDFLQTDAAVNPGSSGGPLVNMEGKVVGLTSAIKTRSGGFQGVGLAVSSKIAKAVAGQLIRNGTVRRPYIGVSVVDLDDGAAKKLKTKPGDGVVVSEVVAKSPGGKANIGVNDIIIKVNGAAVRSARELQRAVLALPVGQEADFIVVRDGKVFRTKVAVEEQAEEIKPAAAKVPTLVDYGSLGLSVTELAADSARRAGLPKEVKGVVVAKVTANSPAARSGLAPGQVILQVNKVLVASPAEFRRAVEQSGAEKGAVLHVLKPNGDVDFVILRTP
jgi:serine protease Do